MKSRMPEIVEPKQLIQSRVLVKRARLTVKRGAARPNGKSKPPQSPLRRAVRYRIRGAARHSTQDNQRGGPPEDALQLIATLTTSQMEAQHNKFGQVASNAIDADLYYPLFCTPYYGYQPTSHTDFLVMVYQLAAFIVHLLHQGRCPQPFFFALCCLGKIPGGAPFSQLHKSGNGSRVDRP